MEAYKAQLTNLKEQSKKWAIEDSQKCWEKYPGKKKSRYSACSLKAVLAYHVFSEGKRELKKEKKTKFQVCKDIFDPIKLAECKNRIYEDMITQVQSLEKWIIRERAKHHEDFS